MILSKLVRGVGFEPTKAYATGWLIPHVRILSLALQVCLPATLPLWPDSCLADFCEVSGTPAPTMNPCRQKINLGIHLRDPFVNR